MRFNGSTARPPYIPFESPPAAGTTRSNRNTRMTHTTTARRRVRTTADRAANYYPSPSDEMRTGLRTWRWNHPPSHTSPYTNHQNQRIAFGRVAPAIDRSLPSYAWPVLHAEKRSIPCERAQGGHTVTPTVPAAITAKPEDLQTSYRNVMACSTVGAVVTCPFAELMG